MKSIGLIAPDLDGTLLDSRKCLPLRNKKALIKCARIGIQTVPTTGRAVDGVVEEIRMLPDVNYTIIANGGTVAGLESTRYLLHRAPTNGKALEIPSIVDRYNAMYDFYIGGRGVTQLEFTDRMEDYGVLSTIRKVIRATRDIVPNITRRVEKYGGDTEKMNACLGDLKGREVPRRDLGSMERIVISSSLYNNLEINTYGAAKGNTLMQLADCLSVDRKATMAFGGGENNISMIEVAEAGVAMGSGLEAVKTIADKITLTDDEDGVVAVIERLIIDWD